MCLGRLNIHPLHKLMSRSELVYYSSPLPIGSPKTHFNDRSEERRLMISHSPLRLRHTQEGAQQQCSCLDLDEPISKHGRLNDLCLSVIHYQIQITELMGKYLRCLQRKGHMQHVKSSEDLSRVCICLLLLNKSLDFVWTDCN